MFKTSELAHLIGVERSFLHYYDRIGIIRPTKNEYNYRQYTEYDLIALASSKYYRAMDMNLESLKDIIHTSGLGEKLAEMEEIQQSLLQRIDYMQDVYKVTEYAKSVYQIAYRTDTCTLSRNAAADFTSTVHDGKLIAGHIDDPRTQALLQQFPFVSYAYHFPAGSLISADDFCYDLGPCVNSEFVEKRNMELPSYSVHLDESASVLFNLVKDIEDGFRYDDFEPVRMFARDNGLSLSGEAIAYCVFTNYGHEHGLIRFVVQSLLI